MNYNLSTLPNGLGIATISAPYLETATFGVFVDVGARWESERENGISHFLEHMAFKGTRKRSARQIAAELDTLGGVSNAYTSHESTVYYAKVLKNDLAKAADLIFDIVLNSTFPEEEVERERNVILQEIAMHKDSPDDLAFDLFQSACFGNTSLGRSILGTEESVSSFGGNDINAYMEAHYQPQRMLVVASGNVRHEEVVKLATDHLGGMKPGVAPEMAKADFNGGDIRHKQKLEQLHLVLGFPGISYTAEGYYAMQVASTILGGGISSRLFQEVRENLGLAYSIYSFASSYTDTGVFGLYAGCSPDKADALISALSTETTKMTKGITAGELERAKAQLKIPILMSLENTTSIFESLGRQLLYFGGYLLPEDILARIDAVSPSEVENIISQTLNHGLLSCTALGDCSHIKSHAALGAMFAATAN